MRTASFPQEIWKTWTLTSSSSPKLKAHRSSVKSLKRCKTNSLVLKGEVISKGIPGDQKLKIFFEACGEGLSNLYCNHFNVDVSCCSFQTLAELAPEWHLSTNSDGAFFWRSRIQEDLLVLDPRIRTHGSNLCSLIVAGKRYRYLFISPLCGLKLRHKECFLEVAMGILWTLSGENEYDDVCLQTR